MRINRLRFNIALARKQDTISDICKEMGISRNRLYLILRSKNISPKTVGKIARALDVDVLEIIENED